MAKAEEPTQSVIKKPASEIDTASLNTALNEMSSVQFKDIDVTFFSHQSRKSTRLIGNTDENNSIKARRDWLSFDLRETLYISSIEVFAKGYKEYDEIELSYIDTFSKQEKRSVSKFKDDKALVEISSFIEGFGIIPGVKILSTPRIEKIVVKGLEVREFLDSIRDLDNINEFREKIKSESQKFVEAADQSTKRVGDLENEIASLGEAKSERETDIENLNAELLTIEDTIKGLEKDSEVANLRISERQNSIGQLEDAIEIKTEERKKLNSDVAESTAKLSQLRGEIHLFPSEISGYVKQSADDIKLYLFISVVPILLAAAVTIRLFMNSENLLKIFSENNNIPIIDYLISRIPYAFVSAAVLTFCYTTLHILFAEIIKINRRRQELFKISIIATDVSFASQKGLALSDEETYNLRTETKMELLKEHLKQHVSEDYKYAPSSGAMKRLLDKLKGKVEEKIDEESDEEAKS